MLIVKRNQLSLNNHLTFNRLRLFVSVCEHYWAVARRVRSWHLDEKVASAVCDPLLKMRYTVIALIKEAKDKRPRLLNAAGGERHRFRTGYSSRRVRELLSQDAVNFE